MKKVNLFFISLMAISLLTNCGCGKSPTPEPSTTYTVILHATDGSSFYNGEKVIFLNNVVEGTPLNECDGYSLPTHERLDFDYWCDEHGNTIAVNAAITSNLSLTSRFYHGPEFERNYVYTAIYDELWNDTYNPVWNSAFADEAGREILTSFTNVTYQTLFDKRLSSVESIDGFKKIYDFAKYEMFTHRDELTAKGEKIIDIIFNYYQETVKEMFNLISDTNKLGTYVNLSYANFVIKCYLTLDSSHSVGVTQYAYQELIKIINDLPSDIDLIETWGYVIPNLLLASYYKGDDASAFDDLVATAKKDIQSLLDNKDYNNHDVKELAKVYGNYYLAVARDTTYAGILGGFVKCIVDNHFSKETLNKLISNVYKQYLVAAASEFSSYVRMMDVLGEASEFKGRIEAAYYAFPTHAQRYYSIAMLFAEAIRRNPSPEATVPWVRIPADFFSRITEETESWEAPYLYYIDSFAAVVKAMSEFDPFVVLENDKKPSYEIYKNNIVEIFLPSVMDQIKEKWPVKKEDFEPIPALSYYLARISNYTTEEYVPFSSVEYDWIVNRIINPSSLPDKIAELHPMCVPAGLLSLKLNNAIVNCRVNSQNKKPREFDEGYIITQLFEYLLQFKNISESDNVEVYALIPLIGEFISTYFLNPFICCEASWDEVFAHFEKMMREFWPDFGNPSSLTPSGISIFRLSFNFMIHIFNQKVIYRGFTNMSIPKNMDKIRPLMVLSFLFDQIKYARNSKIGDDVLAMYDCVFKVLLNEYIPNLTDGMSQNERENLQEKIENKIQALIEDY